MSKHTVQMEIRVKDEPDQDLHCLPFCQYLLDVSEIK